MKILITGGAGFIGSNLCKKLLKKGFEITVLTRRKANNSQSKINFIENLDEKPFNYNAIINLQGSPISVYWNKKNKEEILNSRLQITQKLVEKISSAKNAPEIFISASAVGFYGTSNDKIFNENSIALNQNLFSQEVCKRWEEIVKKSQEKTKLAIIRIAPVLGKNGGIIKKLKLPFSLGFGGKIGSGGQPFCWIALEDCVSAICHILENKLQGCFNLSAPTSSTNLEFSQSLAANLNRPFFCHAPAFAIKRIFGQMAEELLLAGQKVYPKKLLETGFKFKFHNVNEAIKESL
jgi:uncharacterized protein (TIGR01777 family)